MVESIVLGVIQGITEWLPISSEGILIFAKVNFFESTLAMNKLISYALFLHLGTFFAALVYFRKDVIVLTKELFNYRKAEKDTKKLLNFYISVTIISGFTGLVVLEVIKRFEENITITGKGLTLMIGVLLLVTALLQFKNKKEKSKEIDQLKRVDSFILGIAQGASILPGLSRSGLTISAFLLRGFKESEALKLSFLMSLPVILGGNIFLNLDSFIISREMLIGFICSFLLGIFTIHMLLKIANKLNFGWFIFLFALIVILSVFI